MTAWDVWEIKALRYQIDFCRRKVRALIVYLETGVESMDLVS